MTTSGNPHGQRPEEVDIDPVAVVARITTLEMLVRQMMVVQLRMLDQAGHIDLSPAYVRNLAEAYSQKVDEATIIESGSVAVNYEFKANVLHQLERFFDEIAAHIAAAP